MFSICIPVVTDFEILDVFINTFLVDIEVSPVKFISQPIHGIVYMQASDLSSNYQLCS